MSGPDDDELLVGPDHLPAWVIALAVAVAAGLVALVVSKVSGGDSTVSAKPALSSSASSATSNPFVPIGSRPAFGLDGTDEPVVDAAIDRTGLIVLRTNSLLNVSLTGHINVKRHLTGDDALVAQAPGVKLLIDRTHNLGWAVSLIERQTRVMLFDPDTLRPSKVIDNDFIAYDAVLYGGRMYAATAEGIAWLDPSGAHGHVPNVAGTVTSIAADPVRHRLVAMLYGPQNPVIAVTPAGDVNTVNELDTVKATVRVVDGTIWVGAFGASGAALLVRLDPKTLRPILQSSINGRLGPGAIVVGVGDRELYIEPGGEGDHLFCVNAKSGGGTEIASFGPLSVTAARGTAYAVVGRQIVPVSLGRSCAS